MHSQRLPRVRRRRSALQRAVAASTHCVQRLLRTIRSVCAASRVARTRAPGRQSALAGRSRSSRGMFYRSASRPARPLRCRRAHFERIVSWATSAARPRHSLKCPPALCLRGDGEGRGAAEEALTIAERLGDYAIAERVLAVFSNAQDAVDRDAVTMWCARWIELTVKAGDRRCEADALGQSTWPLLWSPNFLDGIPILERAAQICRECGLTPALTVTR